MFMLYFVNICNVFLEKKSYMGSQVYIRPTFMMRWPYPIQWEKQWQFASLPQK